jgi:hypothetical protein
MNLTRLKKSFAFWRNKYYFVQQQKLGVFLEMGLFPEKWPSLEKKLFGEKNSFLNGSFLSPLA